MPNLNEITKLARSMFGSQQDETAQSSTAITGTAVSNSSNGAVSVLIGGETVVLPTVGNVKSGDKVQIVTQNGRAYAVGVIGWGDDIQTEVSETTNHFWTDVSLGAVVSKNERPSNPSSLTGPNTVMGASGIAIRDGVTELAKFASNLIELGKNSINSVISLCGGFATISASTDSASGNLKIQPSIQSQIGSNARIDAGYSVLNGRNYGRISITASDDSGSRNLNYASITVNAAKYYDAEGTSVSSPENVYAVSRGYSGYLYGWTCLVNGTAGTASTAIDVQYAQEVLIAAKNTSSPVTILTAVIPAQLLSSSPQEFRLTGGLSSAVNVGMQHANVSLSLTTFTPQWYYKNGSNVTDSCKFYLFAR